MAEHSVTLELFYDSAWQPAPVLQRPGTEITYRRGKTSIGNETDPMVGSATIDDVGDKYAPLSAISPLYGKIGQNTPVRLSVDGTVQLTGEVSLWEPTRPVKGSPWTDIDLSSVLRRLGRGADPLQSAYTRAQLAAGPVDLWMLDDGRNASSGGNLVTGGAAATVPGIAAAPSFAGLDEALVPAGTIALPDFTNGGVVGATVRGTSTVSWRVEAFIGATAGAVADVVALAWTTGGGITQWTVRFGSGLGDDFVSVRGLSPYLAGTPFGNAFLSTSLGDASPFDGRVHHFVFEVTQTTSTNMNYAIYWDGVLKSSGSNGTGSLIGQQQVGAPVSWQANPAGSASILTVGGVAFYSPKPVTAAAYNAVYAWWEETAGARFARLCLEEGITSTLVGSAGSTMPMGPQRPITLLEQFDEIAVTDDASIFETRTALGLTMRTGVSKLNQATKLRLSYIGQVKPPLSPVFGDEALVNDVTASNPDGSSGRVVQLVGPRNVQAAPAGVGRYKRPLDVNVSADQSLVDAAGWAVLQGTYDQAWYSSVTVVLDMVPGLTAAVDAVEIGDVVEIGELPVQETLQGFRGLVVGIAGRLPPKTREVTFYLIPEAPYRVGLLSITSGETSVLSGRLETDGSTVSGAVAAGAASFSVATASGPLWSTAADDYPDDFVVGGQRVTVSAVTGSSSPQTFTVSTASTAYKIGYPILSGAQVTVYQPIILTM